MSSKAESVAPLLEAGRLGLVLAEDLPQSGAQVGSDLRQAVLSTPRPLHFTSDKYISKTLVLGSCFMGSNWYFVGVGGNCGVLFKSKAFPSLV